MAQYTVQLLALVLDFLLQLSPLDDARTNVESAILAQQGVLWSATICGTRELKN